MLYGIALLRIFSGQGHSDINKSTHKHHHIQQLHCSSVYVPGCFTLVALKSCYKKCTSLTNDFVVTHTNPPFIAGHDGFVYLLVNVIKMCLIVSLCTSTYVHSAIWFSLLV